MQKLIVVFLFAATVSSLHAQRPDPVPAQRQPMAITGGTLHIGNGQVIENGTIVFSAGKIIYAGPASSAPAMPMMQSINAAGKHIYPGLIAPNTQLGLSEIELVRASSDYAETGSYNPGVRSLIAYNTDSRVIPTIRSNGVLLAQVTPAGGRISGTSSVVQLDAWNWEDAQYRADDGLHLNWPSFFSFQFNDNTASLTISDQYEKEVSDLQLYFSQAQSYNLESAHNESNINFEAMSGLFDQGKTLYVHCNYVREIMHAVQFAKDYGIKLVIVGGNDAPHCATLLKENNVSVILSDVHSLPSNEDQAVEQPYLRATQLAAAGVKYCLSVSGYWQVRNLPFAAGTTAAYGLSRADALRSVTLSAAEILGIADKTGSLETGKDANLIISAGDLLDMKTSNVEYAFIQGRQISLDNMQKSLYDTYRKKYGLE